MLLKDLVVVVGFLSADIPLAFKTNIISEALVKTFLRACWALKPSSILLDSDSSFPTTT